MNTLYGIYRVLILIQRMREYWFIAWNRGIRREWIPVFHGLSQKFEVIIPDIIGFGYGSINRRIYDGFLCRVSR